MIEKRNSISTGRTYLLMIMIIVLIKKMKSPGPPEWLKTGFMKLESL